MKTELTISDIESIVVLVQIKGNCHQVLLSHDEKSVLKHLIANLQGGMKLSEQMEPVRFEFKNV